MGIATIPPPRLDDKARALQNIERQLETLTRQSAADGAILIQIRDLLDDFCRILLDSKFRYGNADDRFTRPRPANWKRS